VTRVIRRRALITASLAGLGAVLVLVPFARGGGTYVTVEANGENEFAAKLVATSISTTTFNVGWKWDEDGTTERKHNVRQDDKLFYSGEPTDQREDFVRFVSAGTFHYYCERHGDEGMTGKIIVNPTADGIVTDDTWPIRWAADQSTTGDQYDVRFKVGQNGDWRTWKQNTAKRRAVFGKNDNPVDYTVTKKYFLQARSEKSANPDRRSGWSESYFFGDTPF
jgi:copper binding plastocyanin/azurin family protein